MALESLISQLESERVTPVTPAKIQGLPLQPAPPLAVTSVTPVTPKKWKGETYFTESPNDPSILNTPANGIAKGCGVDPERYEIVEFTDWRLPSGRRVAFKLAIPKEKYDGFELIRILERRDAA